MAKRLALLIGNSNFDDAEFPKLPTPANDVRDFAIILKKYGNFEVGTLLDANDERIRWAIEGLYNHAKRGDLTLLYYSGHGYRDRDRRFYLVAKNTRVSRLLATGISETFIRDAIRRSSSRHRLIILDSCFSGAFIAGQKSGIEPILLDELKGEATAILASSSTIQASFPRGRKSLFTYYLIEGIRTGKADEDQNGLISIDEIFGYAKQMVIDRRPDQTPMREFTTRTPSEIIVAWNPKKLKWRELIKFIRPLSFIVLASFLCGLLGFLPYGPAGRQTLPQMLPELKSLFEWLRTSPVPIPDIIASISFVLVCIISLNRIVYHWRSLSRRKQWQYQLEIFVLWVSYMVGAFISLGLAPLVQKDLLLPIFIVWASIVSSWMIIGGFLLYARESS